MPADSRKSTQRERLIDGMVQAANREGYGGANVSQVIARAGVSRPTFYDYFTDKDDCFLQTNREVTGVLLEHIRDAVAAAPPEQAVQAAVRRLIERAEAEPARAEFLANATMAGGPRALDERDRAIAEIERIVLRARARAAPESPAPDLPVPVLIGAVHWTLSPRVRDGRLELGELADELIAWIERYNRPLAEHRWQTLEPGPPPPPPSPYASDLALEPPSPPPPGRRRVPHAELMHNQRQRIMYATAEMAARKGYTATTIIDIATAAQLDARVFYTHFRDKQQAFLAVHELAIHQILAVGAQAFFDTEPWPERIWQGILAASQFQATYPTISHLGYVEAHAVGSPAIQRIEDSHKAFAIFLQEGESYTDDPPSQTAKEAIVDAIYEIGYRQTRAGQAAQMRSSAYHATYIALAPYIGPEAASEFIREKLARVGTRGRRGARGVSAARASQARA